MIPFSEPSALENRKGRVWSITWGCLNVPSCKRYLRKGCTDLDAVWTVRKLELFGTEWLRCPNLTVNVEDVILATLLYCTLYTDCPDGSTDAVARHVSIAEILVRSSIFNALKHFYRNNTTYCIMKIV